MSLRFLVCLRCVRSDGSAPEDDRHENGICRWSIISRSRSRVRKGLCAFDHCVLRVCMRSLSCRKMVAIVKITVKGNALE